MYPKYILALQVSKDEHANQLVMRRNASFSNGHHSSEDSGQSPNGPFYITSRSYPEVAWELSLFLSSSFFAHTINHSVSYDQQLTLTIWLARYKQIIATAGARAVSLRWVSYGVGAVGILLIGAHIWRLYARRRLRLRIAREKSLHPSLR